MKIIAFSLLLILLIAPANLWAQACCSAGTPLLSSLELPATPKGSWQFALTYEYNTLKNVLSGTEKLDDDTRERLTYMERIIPEFKGCNDKYWILETLWCLSLWRL